jgi:type VI protein secretion system component Hcp
MSKTTATKVAATSERELTEDDLALVSGGKPSAAKSSATPKISESLSLSYEEVKFEYTEQKPY